MDHTLPDLLNLADIQELMDSLHRATAVPSALLDHTGRVLAGNPGDGHSFTDCSDGHCPRLEECSLAGLNPGGEARIHCRDGVFHALLPIHVRNRHLGSLAVGPMALEQPKTGASDPERHRAYEDCRQVSRARRAMLAGEEDIGRILHLHHHLAKQMAAHGERVLELAQSRDLEHNARLAAEAAHEVKNHFLANMSHEVHTPMNGIMGLMQLLQTTNLDAEQEEYVSRTLTMCERLGRLLDDVLSIARIESGLETLRREEFSLAGLFAELEDVYVPAARAGGNTISLIVHEDVPPVLAGDSPRLRQILFNLVGNAVKFTENGHIRAEARMATPKSGEECRLLFTVSDTGIGIPEDKLEAAFASFTQMDGSIRRKYQGAGLGLAIVRRNVELLGGNMSVAGEPGAGTTFHLALPFGLPAEKASGTVRKGVADGPLRVLVVDDDALSTFALKRLLAKLGHKVRSAVNGLDALDALRTESFDLALLDLNMPGMDGVETAKRIRLDPDLKGARDLPIVAVSASAPDEAAGSWDLGDMNGSLAKPVELDALKTAISKAMTPGGRKAGSQA